MPNDVREHNLSITGCQHLREMPSDTAAEPGCRPQPAKKWYPCVEAGDDSLVSSRLAALTTTGVWLGPAISVKAEPVA
jgi:hypothetical protein